MKPIEKELTNLLKENKEDASSDPLLIAFEEASKDFEALVKEGFAKKRGYTLQTVDNAHLTCNVEVEFLP